MTIYFCQKHYNELSQRWEGNLEGAYPGEDIVIDASKCDYLDCPLRKELRCPTCGQELRGKPLT